MGGSEDPFAKIKAGARGGSTSVARPTPAALEHVAPVPPGGPPLPKGYGDLGAPSDCWIYLDAGGAVLRATLRFTKSDGEKDIRPCTAWSDNAGRIRWRLKAEPGLCPLYGLQELAQRLSAPVLVVEGEKTAVAAQAHFPEMVVVTWPGGAKATQRADWRALKGRNIVAFPDADAPGRKAAADVVRLALAAGATTAAVAQVPAYVPEAWDLADPWPAGFGRADALEAINSAHARGAPADLVWPFGFRMDETGLWYDQPTSNGGIAPSHLSAPFEILGEARDPDGRGWGVVVRLRDRDNREHTIPVLRSRLAGGSAEVRAELADAGLIISPARGKADKFAIALTEVKSSRRLTLVSSTGWCGQRYILPGRVIGAAVHEPVLFTGEGRALHYGEAGSLEAWKAGVAAKAVENHLLAFAISLAFVGPLMRLLDLEGGGVHFRGHSSSGKTTLAYAAGSVWGGGGPLGFGQTWRATANALEMVAHGHNDGLAVFDELALVAPEEAGAAAYSLASGQSKARSRSDGSLRQRSEWRIAILSTGEIGLADHIRASKKGDRPMAGQELRLLDIAADAGVSMGVWQDLHGAAGPAALSDAVKAVCAAHYGHAGPAFLERLIVDRDEAVSSTKQIMAAFMVRAREVGDTGQANRALARFAAIAAAGEQAAAFGVLPWPAGTAADAALWLYRRWANAFGRDTPREDRDVLRRLRGVIQSERSAFSPIGDDDTGDDAQPSVGGRDGEARGLRTLGFRHVRGGQVSYWFHDHGWGQVIQGFNPTDAARIVKQAGFLDTDAGEQRLKLSVKIKGERHRLYAVRNSILEADLGD